MTRAARRSADLPLSGRIVPLAALRRIADDAGTIACLAPLNDVALFCQASRPGTTRTLLEAAMRSRGRMSAASVRLVRSGWGEPMIERFDARPPPAFSSSTAGGWRVLGIAEAPRLGVDIETLERVAASATREDRWLSQRERALLATVDPSQVAVELACRWVLKEAYGKLRGTGLGVAFDTITVSAERSGIGMQADGSDDAARLARCRLALASHGPLLLGIVQQARR